MDGFQILPYTRLAVGALGSLVIIGLAVNEYRAAASLTRPAIEHASGAGSYPLRVALRPEVHVSTESYPLRVALVERESPKAAVQSWGLSRLLGDALAMPEHALRRAMASDLTAVDLPAPVEAKQTGLSAARQLTDQNRTSFEKSGRSLADVLNVRFDLTAQFAAGDGLAIRKPLFANGAAKGQVTLRIVQDSRIVARLADLERALGEGALANVRQVSGEKDFVDFDALRSAGIEVRYDAAKDVVLMSAKSAGS